MDSRTAKVLGALYLLGCAVYAGVQLQRWLEQRREREREMRHEADMALRALSGHVAEAHHRLCEVECRVGVLEGPVTAQGPVAQA